MRRRLETSKFGGPTTGEEFYAEEVVALVSRRPSAGPSGLAKHCGLETNARNGDPLRRKSLDYDARVAAH